MSLQSKIGRIGLSMRFRTQGDPFCGALTKCCIFAVVFFCLTFLCSCANYARSVTDIELPWKVIASSGNDRLVEFVIRPHFAVGSVHLAGSFNDWSWPGSAPGRLYAMEYDESRDYWVCSVLLSAGAWEYIYAADDGFFFADEKNAVTRSDGTQISRFTLR
jgi:hypothetical protein